MNDLGVRGGVWGEAGERGGEGLGGGGGVRGRDGLRENYFWITIHLLS